MSPSFPEVLVAALQIEHLRETLGIGVPRPRLSWQAQTSLQNWRQAAYEIEACRADGSPLGATGRVESDQSLLVDWPFDALHSRRQVSLRVRVWGQDGSFSDWSEPLSIEAGLLSGEDWSARFITPDWDEEPSKSNPSPYLRREFHVRPGVKQARLYLSALGLVEAQINGAVVGDHVLTPGWTVYDRRLRYQTFDVTALLHAGPNAIGALLGDGWFRGRIGFGGGKRNIYGERLALLAQLEIEYADGAVERVVTDENWRANTGPLLANSLYDGETYDARLELPGWSSPGFADDGWRGVRRFDWDLNTLIAPPGPPVRRIERVRPIAITRSPSGQTLVDFGQNLVGWLSIQVQGLAGQTVTLRHAEVLEHGELGTRPLRHAEATDRYTLKGAGLETWEPRFTFHGFRYAGVSGWPGELHLDDITAVVIHSDLSRTGWFDCSHPLLNKLHDNVVWGMRGNFVDLPTDCPQRDERLGWTGDLQVFAPTASFLYDVGGFLQSWLADLSVEQSKAGGAVPPFVPNWTGAGIVRAAAAWGDAAAVVPWVLYQRTGDAGILAAQFESMCAWVDHIASLAGEDRLWNTGFQFGDWLDPTAPPNNPGQARTDKTIVASAYFARSAELAGRAAEVLGRSAEKERYLKLAAEVRAAFAHEYVTPAGRLMCDAETAYSLALEFDLLPTPAQRRRAGDELARLVKESGYLIRTGFVGTPLICDALCRAGHAETAYRLLLQTECPSWLYPVTMGATTIWERWDSMLPDGSINPGEMTSFNHYALGAVADWMQRTIGGLAPGAPGYRQIEIRPRPNGGITWARARHLTPYGPAECRWKLEDGQIHLDAIVPPNTTARVTLPGSEDAPLEIGSGEWRWSAPYTAPAWKTRFTLDDPLADVTEDHAARQVIWGVVSDMPIWSSLLAQVDKARSVTLRQALQRINAGSEMVAALDAALIK